MRRARTVKAALEIVVDKPASSGRCATSSKAIGETDRDGLLDTPARRPHVRRDLLRSARPSDHVRKVFGADHDDGMVRDIPLYSLCEHHLLPFFGKAHVAYIPSENGRITGLSKIGRLVDGYARRPQVQERLTKQVADAIADTLKPRGVFVVIEAEHLCMSMRGVRKPGSSTVTSAVHGIFRENAASRSEAMQFLRAH
jgi:GTP cyclohydrolase I